MSRLNLTRKEFILICGTGIVGLIGGIIINEETPAITNIEYVVNIQVNPDEFLYLKNRQGIFFIALGGVGLMQGQSQDFVNSLIKEKIVPYDACEIYTLPKENETSNDFPNLTITTKDGLNYTLTSNDKYLLATLQKYKSDILAKNDELFSEVNSKTKNKF